MRLRIVPFRGESENIKEGWLLSSVCQSSGKQLHECVGENEEDTGPCPLRVSCLRHSERRPLAPGMWLSRRGVGQR